MSITSLRNSIALIFMLFFVLILIPIVVGWNNDRIGPIFVVPILMLTVPVYIANLLLIFTNLFTPTSITAAPDTTKCPLATAVLGISFVILWNLFIAGSLWLFVFGSQREGTPSLINYLQTVVPVLAPVLSVVLAGLFKK